MRHGLNPEGPNSQNPEIYELRHTTVRPGMLNDYLEWNLQTTEPTAGGRTLCVLSGLIGYPPEEIVRVTRYPAMEAWHRAQEISLDTGLAEKEEIRLMRSIASRPKAMVPPEDRRAVYGYRRFFIKPSDVGEFVHDSQEGIWPRIESQDACILGLWTTVAATDPLEVVLLTGYHGPAHWEETRENPSKPKGMDQTVWETSRELRTVRQQLSIRSWVCLMRAIVVAP